MKKLESDIIVVAAGIAGLAAAVAAAEKGSKVIALEKGATTGGAGNLGVGPFAVESRHQNIRQISLTKQEAFRMFMDYTHWQGDARLIQAYIEKSGNTIDWLEKIGVEFTEPAAYFPGSQFTWHMMSFFTRIENISGPVKDPAIMQAKTSRVLTAPWAESKLTIRRRCWPKTGKR